MFRVTYDRLLGKYNANKLKVTRKKMPLNLVVQWYNTSMVLVEAQTQTEAMEKGKKLIHANI